MFKTVQTIALLLAASPLAAASIVYNVNQTIGDGSVVGTITTDGSFGTLAAADVTGFHLTVTGIGASVVLTDADSVVVNTGANFTASASALLFDYSGPAGYLDFQQGSFGTGMKYYCNASTLGDCRQGASAVPQSYNSASAQYQPRTGLQTIATATAVGGVPEPATWALALAGFALTGGMMRRRSISAVAA
ncbi:MAG: PEPxxWA-CTERM sorting domain-containing protein [Janthinobacterium lividum]